MLTTAYFCVTCAILLYIPGHFILQFFIVVSGVEDFCLVSDNEIFMYLIDDPCIFCQTLFFLLCTSVIIDFVHSMLYWRNILCYTGWNTIPSWILLHADRLLCIQGLQRFLICQYTSSLEMFGDSNQCTYIPLLLSVAWIFFFAFFFSCFFFISYWFQRICKSLDIRTRMDWICLLFEQTHQSESPWLLHYRRLCYTDVLEICCGKMFTCRMLF